MRSRAPQVATLALALAAFVTAPHARADESTDPVAAEALFDQARALIEKGDWAEACPKLETSQSLDPAVGTVLNLARCYEHTGKSASAWVRYREAAAMALRQGQKEREALARDRARALKPTLCHLTIRAHGDPPRDIEVQRDDARVDRTTWGTAIPTDEGTHTVTAAGAHGRNAFRKEVTLARESGGTCPTVVVDLPAFSAPPPSKANGPSPTSSPTHDTPGATRASTGGWGARHTLSVVSAGVGLIACGIGTGFALDASAKKSRADAGCSDAGCTEEARQANSDAGRSADFATVSVATGAVFLAGAAILWLTAPSLSAKTTAAHDGLTVRF